MINRQPEEREVSSAPEGHVRAAGCSLRGFDGDFNRPVDSQGL